jgi:hypothetical protein
VVVDSDWKKVRVEMDAVAPWVALGVGSCNKIRSRTVSSFVAEYLVGGFMR